MMVRRRGRGAGGRPADKDKEEAVEQESREVTAQM